MPAAQPLQRRIGRQLAITATLTITLVGIVSILYVDALDQQLKRGVKTAAQSMSYAIALAHVTNNQEIIDDLKATLTESQGFDMLAVSTDGTDMLTGQKVDPARLATYPEHQRAFYYPGNGQPREVGMLYFRRQPGWLTFVPLGLAIISSILIPGMTVWVLLRRFFQREVVKPVSALTQALEGYFADYRFDHLDTSDVRASSQELRSLVTRLQELDHMQRDLRQTYGEYLQVQGGQSSERDILHNLKNYAQALDEPAIRLRRVLETGEFDRRTKDRLDDQLGIIEATRDDILREVERRRSQMTSQTTGGMQATLDQQPFDLVRCVGLTVTVNRTRYAEAPVRIDFAHEAGGEVLVLGDERPVRASLDNLLGNSVRHFTEQRRQGSVAIRIERREDGRIGLTYEDDGDGLPGEVAMRFHMGDAVESRQGWGVGLMFIRANFLAMGGDALYSSRQPHGSRFDLILNEA